MPSMSIVSVCGIRDGYFEQQQQHTERQSIDQVRNKKQRSDKCMVGRMYRPRASERDKNLKENAGCV